VRGTVYWEVAYYHSKARGGEARVTQEWERVEGEERVEDTMEGGVVGSKTVYHRTIKDRKIQAAVGSGFGRESV